MTEFRAIYDAFLAKILDDEWVTWDLDDILEDWQALMISALPWFKFPRVSLDYDLETSTFNEDLSNEEIQIIATYMKCEWLNRTILTWENVKPLYDERDFSQANLLDKFNAEIGYCNVALLKTGIGITEELKGLADIGKKHIEKFVNHRDNNSEQLLPFVS